MKAVIFSISLMFFTSQVLADFCPNLSFRYAKRAEAYLKERIQNRNKDQVVFWCETCSDSVKPPAKEITSVEARKVPIENKRIIDPTAQSQYYNLFINGEKYDLGYTFINGKHIFDTLQSELKLKTDEIKEPFCLENIGERSYISSLDYQPSLVIEAQDEASSQNRKAERVPDLTLDANTWNVRVSDDVVDLKGSLSDR